MKYLIELTKIFFVDIIFYIHQNVKLAKVRVNNPTCRVYEGSQLSNTTLSSYNVIFEDTTIINSTIDSHTYVQKKSTIFNAAIGKFCSIASKISIGLGIHKIDGVSTHPAFYLKNNYLLKTFCDTDDFQSIKRTIVGHDVWIGENAIILDGLTIGTGAIIAAGAVVTKDVQPYSIVAGVPAKFIRFRFSDTEIQILLKSEWWNKSDDWLKKNSSHFTNISEFAKFKTCKSKNGRFNK